MKHLGKARQAAWRLIWVTLFALLLLCGVAVLASMIGGFLVAMASFLFIVWLLFAVFTLYFFRDPSANAPSREQEVVSPAHGKVDLIDETTEPNFMGGTVKRISIFLSVVDVHVQKAPLDGTVEYLKHSSGKFLNALKAESATHNENVLIGFASKRPAGDKIAIRLIAGLLARRILPWVAVGENVTRGERVSLIQFGSRCDVYLPVSYRIRVKLGDRVIGGESIIAEKV